MKDKVIVITGASAGIGAALAQKLGAGGSRLALSARRGPELQAVATRSGTEALAVVADMTRRADVERLRDEAIARFGHIDVWVNNAGLGIRRHVEDLTDDDIDTMISANLKSALYGMQAVLGHFKERRKGHIINISSTLGRVPIVSFRSAYSAAKHALNALTANLRMDLRDGYPDIAVSLVLPGPVATEFAEKAVGAGTAPRMDMAPPQTQTADEVAGVIADVIERPCAEVYTMPGHAEFAARYYQDVAAAEAQMAQMMRGGRR